MFGLGSVYDNVSRVITKAKCRVLSITLSGDGDVGGVTLYNGVTAKGETKTRVIVASGDGRTFNFQHGLICEKGCYIVVDNANSKYTIVFDTIDEKVSV